MALKIIFTAQKYGSLILHRKQYFNNFNFKRIKLGHFTNTITDRP